MCDMSWLFHIWDRAINITYFDDHKTWIGILKEKKYERDKYKEFKMEI